MTSCACSQGNTHQRTFSGNGADGDIVVSSARAYVSAINKLIAFVSKSEQRQAEQAAAAAAAENPVLKSTDEQVLVGST